MTLKAIAGRPSGRRATPRLEPRRDRPRPAARDARSRRGCRGSGRARAGRRRSVRSRLGHRSSMHERHPAPAALRPRKRVDGGPRSRRARIDGAPAGGRPRRPRAARSRRARRRAARAGPPPRAIARAARAAASPVAVPSASAVANPAMTVSGVRRSWRRLASSSRLACARRVELRRHRVEAPVSSRTSRGPSSGSGRWRAAGAGGRPSPLRQPAERAGHRPGEERRRAARRRAGHEDDERQRPDDVATARPRPTVDASTRTTAARAAAPVRRDGRGRVQVAARRRSQ